MSKHFASEREYLISLDPPLAKPGRGRFSQEAKDALVAARKSGITFGTPEADVKGQHVPLVGSTDENRSARGASINPASVRSWAKESGYDLAKRGRIPSYIIDAYLSNPVPEEPTDKWLADPPKKQVRVRQVRSMYGLTVEGYRVGFSTCRRCLAHISMCACSDGPKPPSVVDRVLAEFDPIEP